MKTNILKGMILMSVMMVSSCYAPNKLAGSKNTVYNDDVYYSKAKAGDKIEDTYANVQNNYQADNDYYYYGDYASRLSRFSDYSPFDYDDDFYYSYIPYNNGFGESLTYNLSYYGYNFGYGQANLSNPAGPINTGDIYSPYDYGYMPYYDLGGFDDFGYGDIYSVYILGGGGGGRSAYHHYNHKANTVASVGVNPNVRGARSTPSPGVTRIAAGYYPGKPTVSLAIVRNMAVNANGANSTAAARQTRDGYRPAVTQNVSQTSSSSSSASVSSGGGGGASSGGGGGGRPVRP